MDTTRDLKMDVVGSRCLTGTEWILQAPMFASHLFEDGAAAERSDYLSFPLPVPTSRL